MPRNGSGTYSVPNSYSSGQTITAAIVNANFSDVGSELTNSVAKDGQTTMTGPLRAAAGTAAAPSMTFGVDTNTGFYRIGADRIGVALGGIQSGELPTGAGSSIIDAFASGTVMLFAQTAAPTGWTKSTSHNDKALRVVSGAASSGGTTAFSSVFAARTIAVENLPAHTHTGTTDGGTAHAHHAFTTSAGNLNLDDDGPASVNGSGLGDSSYLMQKNTGGTATVGETSAESSHTHDFTTDATGSGTAVDFAVQYVDVILAAKD